MPNRFSKIATESATKTNEELADLLTGVLPITTQEMDKFLPLKGDKEELAELMAIVDMATTHNRKVAKLLKNIDRLADVTVKVLGAVAR